MNRPQIGKNIRLPIKEHDTRISDDKLYLVRYDNRFAVGKFYKLWYGWNFSGFYSAGLQVDYEGWQGVWEFCG